MTEKVRLGILENAPGWWPNFEPPEFSEQEELQIERYCAKIVENVAAEKGMTPWERWKATASGEIPDRPMVHMLADPCAVSRILDCWSYSNKLGFDVYNYPKLFVMANFAQVAKFKFDLPCPYTLWAATAMVEWGGSSRAKLMPTMMPTLLDGAIKTEADFDRIHMPDIKRDGLLPPSIWALRKIKEYMKKYGVSEVMPLMAFTESAPHAATIVLMGMKAGLATVKRNPEMAHKCSELTTKFSIDYVKAMREAGADITISSGELACSGIEKGKPFNKYFLEIANAAGPNHLWCDSAMGEVDIEYRCQTKSFGTESGTGWYAPCDIPFDYQRRLATEYKKVFGVIAGSPPSFSPPRTPSDVAETVKKCIKACAGPGFFVSCNQDYFSTIDNLSAYVKTAQEYGKELYKELK